MPGEGKLACHAAILALSFATSASTEGSGIGLPVKLFGAMITRAWGHEDGFEHSDYKYKPTNRTMNQSSGIG